MVQEGVSVMMGLTQPLKEHQTCTVVEAEGGAAGAVINTPEATTSHHSNGISQNLLFDHHLVLVVGAPLVFTRPKMPNPPRVRWRASRRRTRQRKTLMSASYVLRLSSILPSRLAITGPATYALSA